MKARKYLILTIAGILFGTAGCNDDFMERVPLSKISDGLFWKSTNDLELYLNNLYSKSGLLPHYNSFSFTVIGPYTDDADDGSDILVRVDYNKRMNSENTLPTSGGGWSESDWELLRNINYFMAHYGTVDEDFSRVAPYVGEALFFRAIFYFKKLKRFGALPWAPDLLDPDSEELYSNRLPRNQIVDSLMNELDLAVEYLPARGNGGAWTGRVNKETALALQARIALFEGTWEKYHALKNTPFRVQGGDNGQHFLEKAAEAAGALMAMAAETGYPGLDNVGQANGYWDLFNQKKYSSSKEVLFWREYSTAADQLFHRWYISYTGAGIGITKRLVDMYLCTDGKPIYIAENEENPLYGGDDYLVDVVKNRDPRLNQTICVDDGEHYRWKEPVTIFEAPMITAELSSRNVTGYQLYKGHSADKAEYDARKSTTGCIYFRYAEALLIYAEAKAELGTITQDDIDKTVNALRKRVGMTDGLLDMNDITTDPNWLFETSGAAAVSPLIQEIRRERTVELACEGFRVDDIFRWAAADVLIKGYKPKGIRMKDQLAAWDIDSSDYDYIYEDAKGYMDPYAQYMPMATGYKFNTGRDYLYPIPTSELTLNPALRPQNPGW